MAEKKMVVNIGSPTGKTHKIILEEQARAALFGLKIGDEFEGSLIGPDYDGYKFKITGGSDENGVPMRPDLHMEGYMRILVSGGVGFRPKRKGERRRKRMRGNIIQDDISQLNVKVIEEGKKPLE